MGRRDGALTPLEAVTLPARIAMRDAMNALLAYAERSAQVCARCPHERWLHGDKTYGCLGCPVRYRWWWSTKVVPNHAFAEAAGG